MTRWLKAGQSPKREQPCARARTNQLSLNATAQKAQSLQSPEHSGDYHHSGEQPESLFCRVRDARSTPMFGCLTAYTTTCHQFARAMLSIRAVFSKDLGFSMQLPEGTRGSTFGQETLSFPTCSRCNR